jgi:FixJ family two-component response regulator
VKLSFLAEKPNIPVIMFTTSSQSKEKEPWNWGAADFITRPKDYKTLRELLNSVLQKN